MKGLFPALKRFLAYSYRYAVEKPGRKDRSRLPQVINLPITDNCNSRCVMCDVWKAPSSDEVNAAELKTILSNRLFVEVKHVGISGGEPTLRKDLLEIVEAIIESLPQLKSLSMTTHGFNLKRHERFLGPIHEICQSNGVSFHLGLSIDGVDSVHDEIRGIPNGYSRSLKCLRMARGLGIPVQIQSTISRRNIHELEGLSQLAEEESTDIIFRKATAIPRLDNLKSIEATGLSSSEDSFFVDFIESDRCRDLTPAPARRLWYRALADMLRDNAPRTAPCSYQNEGVLLSAHGELYPCSITTESYGDARNTDAWKLYHSEKADQIRARMLSRTCPGCVHDQSGRWPPLKLLRENLVRSRMGKWIRQHRPRIGYCLGSIRIMLGYRFSYKDPGLAGLAGGERTESPREALLIGCYGGEHVGDAAILGGVCLRLSRLYGIDRFHVLSIRKHRTERWVRSIDLPQEILVHDYCLQEAEKLMPSMKAVALAGGPLMELPGLIDRHLVVAACANKLRIPFIIEGIGYGPFRKRISRFVARGVLLHASSVKVRSEADRAKILNPRIDVQSGRDPAFDYLESRISPQVNLGLPVYGRQVFETSKPVISINLRPLWEVYKAQSDTATPLRQVMDHALAELASVITERSQDFRFLFIPFNADQFGFSDLGIGLTLRRRIGTSGDFTVLQRELDIDEALAIMNNSTGLIAMRFHACIFGLSAGIPVMGLDYAIGEQGKVSHLMESMPAPNLALPVRTITAEALHAFLNSIQSGNEG